MKILFPSDELNSKVINESFELEYNAAKTIGFDVHLYDEDRFIRDEVLISTLPKLGLEAQHPTIMRTWMMNIDKYKKLYDALYFLGYALINDPEQYKHCHYFSESYYLLENNTPKIVFFPNLTKELFKTNITPVYLDMKLSEMRMNFSSDYFILKDSVKSEKNTPELFKIPLNISGQELHEKIEKFIDKRGKSYNNGIMFKEFVNLLKHSGDLVNEWRIFVLNKNIVSVHKNTGIVNDIVHFPDLSPIKELCMNIKSNFFTIDVAELEDGSWTVIETGDGQVSGLSPGQNELLFYEDLKKQII